MVNKWSILSGCQIARSRRQVRFRGDFTVGIYNLKMMFIYLKTLNDTSIYL